MFVPACDLSPQINCCIKVAQNGQRCQYQFAPPFAAVSMTGAGVDPELFAEISQPIDFA